MRVLFVSSWFPVPVDNGSRIRVHNLLRSLSRNHEVTLLSFAEPAAAAAAHSDLPFCKAVEVFPARPFDARAPHSPLSLLRPAPRSIVATHEPRLASRVAQLLTAGGCDVVIASQLRAAAHVVPRRGAPAIFEEVELGALHQNFAAAPTPLGRARHGLTWLKHRLYLRRLLREFTACTVVSTLEGELLRGIAPRHAPPVVIPNGLDLADYAGDHTAAPETLVYAGSLSYAPNFEAVDWFLRHVYPELRRRFPALRLTVTGDPGGHALRGDGVVQTGIVADVRPHVGGAWASVVPLHSGGGTRLKVLESMALGTPVIATAKGVEGLDVVDGEHVLIADDAPAFVAATARLLGDPQLRARLAARGRALVRERYDWNRIAERFEELLEAVARRAAERSHHRP